MKTLKQLVALFVALLLSASVVYAQNNNSKSAKAGQEKEQVTADVKIKAHKQFTVIDFNATWCNPCRQFAPTFENAAKKYGKKAEFKSIDIDKNQSMAAKYEVSAIPCVVVLKDGKEVARQVGLISEPEFIKFLNDAFSK